MNFDEFELDSRILDAIKNEGYTNPTPIQQRAIPPALKGSDVLGCAQTGTGKTCAFALPILNNLSKTQFVKKNYRQIRCLILTPTRELALQIQQSFNAYGKFMPLRVGLVMGGVGQEGQIKALKKGVDILIATPGRFIDLVNQNHIDTTSISIFVLDEADRMLDMGFFPDVKRIEGMISKNRQTLFFSATMPDEVKKLAQTFLKNAVYVAVNPVSSTVDKIDQWVCLTNKTDKPDLLIWTLNNIDSNSTVLIFTRTKHGADRLTRKLIKAGINSKSIHGDKSQSARQSALNDFKTGKCKVLVATDIASRGLDIEDITHVINYELPNEPETYVHRIGRTARAGKEGMAISLCDFDEKPLLSNIETLINKQIDVESRTPFPMTVFKKTIKKPRPPKNPQKPQKQAN